MPFTFNLVPSDLSVREGESESAVLRYSGQTGSFTYSYAIVLDGTASEGDIFGSSGSGSVSIASNVVRTKDIRISLSAPNDESTESLETASLRVSLNGDARFSDGSQLKLFEIAILDFPKIYGTDANEFLITTSDAPDILSSGGDDRLEGDTRSNELDGGAGRDVLIGRGGEDILTGGRGADVFAFLQLDGNSSTIVDFDGRDRIALDDSYFAKISDESISVRNVTQEQAQAAFRSGAVSYDRETGEFAIDDQVVFKLEGAPGIDYSDFLLF